MPAIGTPLSSNATTALILGAGELGKELVIELQRLGVEVVAVDRYPNAPAMQVAHRSRTVSMLDEKALMQLIEEEQPDLIIPEIEAIAVEALIKLEERGFRVTPTAKAVSIAMNREWIRRLAAEELGLPTTPYKIVSSQEDYLKAVNSIGFPCVVKPMMSSSGKGQSFIKDRNDAEEAWESARTSARGKADKVIVEGFIDFDYEITLLTVRYAGSGENIATSFCEPIGHLQENGDYRQSWQPHPMPQRVLEKAKSMAETITSALGGMGIFGVELFIKGEDVLFNEVSPRPHDTGMVTMISQNLSQFALHARAILGLPIPKIRQLGPAASSVILARGNSKNVSFNNLKEALSQEGTEIRLFGKPEVDGERRMGVALALGETLEGALQKARYTSSGVKIGL